MNYLRLKKFFEENPTATEAEFFAQEDIFFDWDYAKKKVESPEGMKALQSVFDRERTKAIQSFEEKTVPTRVEKILAEKLIEKEKEWKKNHNVKDDPALIEVEKLRQELREAKTEAQREKLMGLAKSKLPSELHNFADRFLDEDEDRTSLRIESLIEAYNQSVNRAVESTLKGGKMTPSRSEGVAGKVITKESINSMSREEIIANKDEVLKAHGF